MCPVRRTMYRPVNDLTGAGGVLRELQNISGLAN